MDEYGIRELTPEDYPVWDALVEQSPQGTVFHSSSWLLLASGFFNSTLRIIGVFDGEDLIGGCSLFVCTKFHLTYCTSTNLVSQYGGIVIAERMTHKTREREQFYNSIVKKICEYLHEKGLDRNYIEITNSPGLTDIRPFLWQGWNSSVRYTYQIDLRKDIDHAISRDIRKKINHCTRQSIVIKKSTDAAVHHKLVSDVIHREDADAPPKEFFEAVVDLAARKNIGEMWAAETPAGEIIASRIILWDTKRAYAWTAASAPEFAKLGVTAFLFNHVLHTLQERGFKEIDVMQANIGRFSMYITGFNPCLLPNYTVYKKSLTYDTLLKVRQVFRS